VGPAGRAYSGGLVSGRGLPSALARAGLPGVLTLPWPPRGVRRVRFLAPGLRADAQSLLCRHPQPPTQCTAFPGASESTRPLRAAAMDAIVGSLKSFSSDIATACNPAIDVNNRATAGWWLTDLHEAVAVLAVYAVIVLVGIAVWSVTPAAPKSSAERKSSGPLTWSEVGARFSASPVMTTLKIVYNTVQVVLCIWMVAFTLINAGRAGYFEHYAFKVSPTLPQRAPGGRTSHARTPTAHARFPLSPTAGCRSRTDPRLARRARSASPPPCSPRPSAPWPRTTSPSCSGSSTCPR